MQRTVQWQGDNQAEVDKFLSIFAARSEKSGDVLHISALNKQGSFSNIRLELGDSLIFDNGRVGVTRGHLPDVEPMVEWAGENAQEIANFLQSWSVDMRVIGDDLYLMGQNAGYPTILHRGDRIIERVVGGKTCLVMSVAGKDHRV